MKDFLTLMCQDNVKSSDGSVDFDVAEFCLGAALGLWQFDDNFDGLRAYKGLFWSNNKVGNALHHMLQEMVKAGILGDDLESGRGDGCGYRVKNYPWKDEEAE